MLRYFKKQFLYALTFFLFGAHNVAANVPLVQSNPVTGAGGQTYQPIIEGVGFVGADVESTLLQLFTWGVTLAIILAIIMLIIGGIQYMGSESIFAKGDGIKRMQAALGGMFIALLCIFILNLILGSGGGGPFNVGTRGVNTPGGSLPVSQSSNPAVTNNGTQSGVQMNSGGTIQPTISQTGSTGIAPTSQIPPGARVDDFGRIFFDIPQN